MSITCSTFLTFSVSISGKVKISLISTPSSEPSTAVRLLELNVPEMKKNMMKRIREFVFSTKISHSTLQMNFVRIPEEILREKGLCELYFNGFIHSDYETYIQCIL